MANLHVEVLFGDKIDINELKSNIIKFLPVDDRPSGDFILALIILQLINRIEKLESKGVEG